LVSTGEEIVNMIKMRQIGISIGAIIVLIATPACANWEPSQISDQISIRKDAAPMISPSDSTPSLIGHTWEPNLPKSTGIPFTSGNCPSTIWGWNDEYAAQVGLVTQTYYFADGGVIYYGQVKSPPDPQDTGPSTWTYALTDSDSILTVRTSSSDVSEWTISELTKETVHLEEVATGTDCRMRRID
jgi:hypothetical protein